MYSEEATSSSAADDNREGEFVVQDDWFECGGSRCAVRVYRPAADGLVRPTIVMAHGFGAVRALRLYAYAERFAAAGYVVLVFDYRGFGESEGEPRQVLSVRKQHEDWRAALRYARSLPDVAPDRLVAWGTSFGGGHVISIAGQGEPLAAVIAQVPHVSGPTAVLATNFGTAARVAVRGIQDIVGSWFGRPPVLVDSVGVPGTTAMMSSPDAHPGMIALLEESGLAEDAYPRTVAARIGVLIGLYSPRRWAHRITCPILVQIAANDAITPRSVAERAAGRMKHATVRTYDCGHFDPYVDPLFETVIADQIAFLQANVPPVTSTPS